MAIRLTAYPAQTQITPLPFESLLKAGALQQERIDKADDTLGKLSEEFGKIKPIKQDVDLTRDTLAGYQKRVSDIVAKSNGNTAAMMPDIKNLVREFNTDVAYGQLNAVMQRRASQDASFKEKAEANQEHTKSGGDKGMSREDYNLATSTEFQNQENLIQDPLTGKWTTASGNIYSAVDTRYTPNLQKEAMELSKLITPETITELNPNLQKTNVEGIYYNTETNREYSFPEARISVLVKGLKGNPINANYYNWKNTISGNGEAVSKTYNELASRNFISQDAQGNPIQFNPSYVQELAEKSLYPELYNVAEAIGTLTAVNKSKSGISFIKDFDSKIGNTSTVIPLNIPYDQSNGVQKTTNELSNFGVISGFNLVDRPGSPKSAYNEFIGTTTPKQLDPTKAYSSFTPLTRERIDFIKPSIPELAEKPYNQFTNQDWDKVNGILSKYNDKKISAVKYAETNGALRKSNGATYNAQMEDFVFYDVDGQIGKNANNIYSGAELRQLGAVIDEQVGTISSANIIPEKIIGDPLPYTFVSPDVVTLKSQNGTTGARLYVNKNRAQLQPGTPSGNNYMIDLLQNQLSQASQIGLPTELFNDSQIIVIPTKDGYTIKLPSNETFDLKAQTPEEMRSLVIQTFFPKNPTTISTQIQSILKNKLFKEQ